VDLSSGSTSGCAAGVENIFYDHKNLFEDQELIGRDRIYNTKQAKASSPTDWWQSVLLCREL